MLEVLHRLGRPQQGKRPLQLVDPHHLGQVAADQRDAIVGGELALPAVRLDLERLPERRGHAALSHAGVLLGRRGWRRELVHPLLAHDDPGGGTKLRDVRLASTDGQRDHAYPGPAGDP